NRRNALLVEFLGDLLERHSPSQHRVDSHPPSIVTPVAEPMREPDVVRGEVTSVRLEPRVVVGRRRPGGTRRLRLEVPPTAEAVALGHLTTHVDELAVPGKLPEDSANSQRLELLHRSLAVHSVSLGRGPVGRWTFAAIGGTRQRPCRVVIRAPDEQLA